MTTHKISEEGLQQLIEREGLENKRYLDSAGLPTIGVGHLLTQSERHSGKIIIAGKAVLWKKGLTETQIRDLLTQDLARFETAILRTVCVPLSQGQFDALVSFAFNIGVSAFSQSTLLKKLNQYDYSAIPGQLNRWVYADGKRVKGLENRRRSESEQWLSA